MNWNRIINRSGFPGSLLYFLLYSPTLIINYIVYEGLSKFIHTFIIPYLKQSEDNFLLSSYIIATKCNLKVIRVTYKALKT